MVHFRNNEIDEATARGVSGLLLGVVAGLVAWLAAYWLFVWMMRP